MSIEDKLNELLYKLEDISGRLARVEEWAAELRRGLWETVEGPRPERPPGPSPTT